MVHNEVALTARMHANDMLINQIQINEVTISYVVTLIDLYVLLNTAKLK